MLPGSAQERKEAREPPLDHGIRARIPASRRSARGNTGENSCDSLRRHEPTARRIPGGVRCVVVNVSQPDTVEERQICTDDTIGIESRGRHTYGNLSGLEQQPHPSSARTCEVELDSRTFLRQQLVIESLVNRPDQPTSTQLASQSFANARTELTAA
jgi:hypothetical protein